MEGSTSMKDFAQLKALIEDIKVGMLTTADDDGTLRSRPLQTVGVDDDGSVSGTATLSRDREKMRQMWTKWVEVFFPKGLDDPDLALLRVDVEKAEYWDAPGSTVGRLYALAKGLATGKTDALGENQKLNR
jgi:general stress protein 26